MKKNVVLPLMLAATVLSVQAQTPVKKAKFKKGDNVGWGIYKLLNY